MLDVCLLGTGGMMPLPYRWLTSLMTRCDGSNLLIDCGEGTQVALKEKGWSPKPVAVIMIGPKGLERVVGALRTIAPELPFPLRFIELSEPREQFQIGPYVIDAYKVNHNVTCYGYSISIPRKGRFDVERARQQQIPQKYWNRLQKGETVQDGERTLTPDMVLGPARKGIRVTYCTDTRPVPVIAEYAKEADLFICEGMYGEDGKATNAREYKHMTMYEAASLARTAKPAQMWLTHYSPSLNRPEEYMDKVREIFPEAKAAKDGWTAELGFEED